MHSFSAKEMPASVRQVSKVVIEDPCDQYNDRLAQLEGLQYELTKQVCSSSNMFQ